MKSVSFSQEEKAEKPKVSREQALRVARQLGCRGAHENENGDWMPCGSMEEFVAIQKGKEEYLVATAKKKSALTTIEYRTRKFSEKAFAYYEDKEQALKVSKLRGCGSVRTVVLNGKRFYAPCDPKPPKNGWEDLGTGRGVVGISNTADGGLVSTPIAGKSDESTEKGFVPNVSRSTDPDTFSDPDSARIRARNLGCIGIRRYTARDGKLVWMPCSNGSDYNKRMGIRGDNSPKDNPRSRRKGKSLGQTLGQMSQPTGSSQQIDGDGDGLVSSVPGGPDDTPVRRTQKLEKGQIEAGNIDLNNRPVVKNRDGSISTVRSITITEGNRVVVIPTVLKGKKGSGKIVSDSQAIAHYRRSGQHLGKFNNIPDADNYANRLHNQQAQQYVGKSVFDESLVSLKGVPKPKKKSPIIDSDIVNNLAIKVRKHNALAKKDGSKTNLRDVKIVFMRGLEDSDEKGAFKRVSDFLSLLINGKPKDSKYREDNDLLPLDHPLKNSKSSVKSDLFDEGSYGVKFDGCCPKVIKRHRKV